MGGIESAAHLNNRARIAIGSTTRPHEQIELYVYEVEQDRKLSLLECFFDDHTGIVSGFRPHQARRGPSREKTGVRRRERHGVDVRHVGIGLKSPGSSGS